MDRAGSLPDVIEREQPTALFAQPRRRLIAGDVHRVVAHHQDAGHLLGMLEAGGTPAAWDANRSDACGAAELRGPVARRRSARSLIRAGR